MVMLWCLSLFAYGYYEVYGGKIFPDTQMEGASGTYREEQPSGESQPQAEGQQASHEIQPLEVHFLDVGQGDCTFLRCGGQTMLIDAGEEDQGTAIQYYLKKQEVERLDYLVLTHPDSDHIGSADVVITKFEIGQVMMSGYEKDNSTYRNLMDALEYKSLKAEIVQPGERFALGSAVCTILGPTQEYGDSNNASICLLVENGQNVFLFTGDAEKEAEGDLLAQMARNSLAVSENVFDLDADVYKAGHHGSSTSSSEAFLDAVSPDYAVVSCGEHNAYGHPHQETLEAFGERNIQVFRTDEQGNIVAVADGEKIAWSYEGGRP